MATTTAMCTSFKVESWTGTHNFTTSTGDTFKLALIKVAPAGTYGAASTNYSDITGNSDEVGNSGTYSAGGLTLTNVTPTSSGTTAFTDFGDVSATSATISATACMIYNDTASGASVSTHDFGGTKTSTAGTFSIVFPTANSTLAILRFA